MKLHDEINDKYNLLKYERYKNKIRVFLESLRKDNITNIVIWGAGRNGIAFLYQLKNFNIDVKVTDSNNEIHETRLPTGHIVEPVTDALFRADIVLTANKYGVDAIECECNKRNIRFVNIQEILFNSIYKFKEDAQLVAHLRDLYRDTTCENLCKKIQSADVISFDVFDTILIRRTLFPKDVFEIVEGILGIKGFALNRQTVEKELQQTNPKATIHDIYDRLNHIFPNEGYMRCKKVELETELKVLSARTEVIKAIEYAYSLQKIVYFTSDMYLPNDIIADFLKRNGVPANKEQILVSCDYGVSKRNGLFDVLCNKCGENKKILHIGDNYDSDILAAEVYGIDLTFKVPSVREMLAEGICSGLLKYQGELSSRLIIGEFISKVYRNPFLFSYKPDGFGFESVYDWANIYIAPLAFAYFCWAISECKRNSVDLILFCARDCYVLKLIYDSLKDIGEQMPEAEYFYTSRSAVFCGLPMNKEDIVNIVSCYSFQGTSTQLLKARFFLNDNEFMIRTEGETDEEYIVKHESPILKNAKRVRDNYNKYLVNHNISKTYKIAVCDLASRGTVQAFIHSLKINTVGIYLQTMNTAYVSNKLFKDLNMNYFIEGQVADKSTSISKYYHLLETIFSSSQPSVKRIDENGEPVFNFESREKDEINDLSDIHKACVDYAINSMMKISDAVEINVDLISDIIGLLDKCEIPFNPESHHSEFDNLKRAFSGGVLE